MEQEIVESVLENDVVVLSGETGCGKTTQASIFPDFAQHTSRSICLEKIWGLHIVAIDFFLHSVSETCWKTYLTAGSGIALSLATIAEAQGKNTFCIETHGTMRLLSSCRLNLHFNLVFTLYCLL